MNSLYSYLILPTCRAMEGYNFVKYNVQGRKPKFIEKHVSTTCVFDILLLFANVLLLLCVY